MKKNDMPIIIEALFHNSIESIWNAITDIKEMRKWYFPNIPNFKPVFGFKTGFNVKSGERNFFHKWEVVDVQINRLIKYNWEFENYSGKSSTTFELFKLDNGTKLILTVNIYEDFSEGIPEFTHESCITGWEYFINKRLSEYLRSK